ncbi:MAG: response regulator [Candidatus Aminicenantes bacterium]|nr:MAG: response regulator [Candidatus Aminicenantes bacterium]RLE02425.1 MAG: response regulator [Candidatus Aminicenantes bacterium]
MRELSGPLKALIAEDEAIVALELEDRFLSMGWEVAGITARGEEAINLAGTKRPDLVVMDINLKGEVDGIKAAEKIYRLYSIPSIYVTACPFPEIRKRMSSPYYFPVIIKPFDDEVFHQAVKQALNFSPGSSLSSSPARGDD